MLRKLINLKEGTKLTCGAECPVGRDGEDRRARHRRSAVEGRNPRRGSNDGVRWWIAQAGARKCSNKSRGRSDRLRGQGKRVRG